jgi:hypothetical protein
VEGGAILVKKSLIAVPILTLGGLVMIGCGSGRASHTVKESFHIDERPIPPERCRIVATVIRIDEQKLAEGAGDPCSGAPCYAVIRIDSVLGTGRTFNGFLSVGITVNARFNYSVSPVPRPPLPGVSNGSRFRAEVVATGGEFADVPGPYMVVVDEYSLVKE